MNIEKPNQNENPEKNGVQEVKVENNHYIVSVIWKNGRKNDRIFPVNGFSVVNPETQQKLGYLSGDEAVSILKNHSPEYNSEDFSWIPFVLKGN